MPGVLAIVGMPGAGKSSLVELLTAKQAFEPIYFGGVVLEEVEAAGLEVNAENESLVRLKLRKELGMAAVAHKRMPRIKAALASDKNVLVDSIYSYAEYELLKNELGDGLTVLALHAMRSTRHARLAKRATRPLTAAEADERDRREIEDLDKGGPIALADVHILNDTTISDLSTAVDRCLEYFNERRMAHQ